MKDDSIVTITIAVTIAVTLILLFNILSIQATKNNAIKAGLQQCIVGNNIVWQYVCKD